jgi:CheY-like chemotaxis protein
MLEKLLGENIELRTSFEAPLGCVLADEGQLTQVLVKLAANARNAMPDGGAMAIRTANCTVSDLDPGGPGDPPPGEYVRISITETSKGIDEATQQPGFDDGSTTAEPDRGLSSVYGIVRRLGGWIAVDGKDGEETTFMIILPRIDSGSAGGLVPESLRGSETVLLGLAEQDQRERVNGVLREAGYQVLAGSDGAEVLALAETHTGPIHLLLTELDLPRLSGCDLAQRVQARHRLAKVVYTTGATKDGVDETQNLLEKVRETLGPRRTIPRILVVDDDPAVARVFRRILTGGGYEVDVVHGGDAALRYLSANSVDLVLTDLVMPDGEGLAMIRAIRQRQPDLKIIAASGAFEGQFLKAANAFGADASLRKPIDPKDLLEKTRELLSAG